MGRALPTAGLSFWSNKTVVVSGATGFLGGWLIRKLLDQGANVVAIVRDPERPSQFVCEALTARATVAVGAIDDVGFIERTLATQRIDALFHTASMADINLALADPLACFRSSALATWQLLDVLRRLHPDCVTVVSSSDKAYGSQRLPYRESSPLTPLHPYEVAKATQDLATQSFGKMYGLPVAATRCGNLFGPYDFMSSRLVPGVCQALALGERPRLRSDGAFTRDFFYVEDAADAQLLLAERLASDPSLYGEAFNLSYGVPVSVRDLVARLMVLAGMTGDPLIEDRTRAEIRDMHLSPRKARALLGWRPRIGLQDGLRQTVAWYLTMAADAGSAPLTDPISTVQTVPLPEPQLAGA